MINVVDFDQPTKALRLLAKAFALGAYTEAEALLQLQNVFNIGKLAGKTEAYRAERQAIEAATERRRQKAASNA